MAPRRPLAWTRRVHRCAGGVLIGAALLAPSLRAQSAQSAGESEVTVTGSRPLLGHSRAAPSVASTVVEGPALQAAGSSSADVLMRVPGVQVSRSGSEADLATASIRGADSSQTPVYLAGIRLNDDISGTADLSTIPLWMIQRVEVFRGNAPQVADRLGLGGAVFFWPRMPSRPRSGALVEVGSYGQRAVGVAQEYGDGRAAALVSLRGFAAENDFTYRNDFGQRFSLREESQRRENADFDGRDAWAVARYRLGKRAHINAVINAFDREQGITGLAVIPAERARSHTARLLGGLSARTACAAQEEDCLLELSSSALAARSILRDPAAELWTAGGGELDNRGRRFQQRTALSTRLAEWMRLRVATEQAVETLHIETTGDERTSARRLSTRPSVAVALPLTSRLSLHTLAAVECHGTDATVTGLGARSTSHSGVCGTLEPVARTGAVLEVGPGFQLLGNIGRYVRTPTLGELYGTSSVVQGNASLGSEHGVSSDLGLRTQQALDAAKQVSVALDAFAFARWSSDLIRYQRVSTAALAPFNVSSARVLGVEAALAFDWRGHLRGYSAVTALDPRETTADPVRDPTQNDILPLTSRLVTSSEIELYLQPRTGAIERAGLSVTHQHRAARFEDPAGLTVLPAQDTFDVSLGCQFGEGHFSTRAAVRNVFDEHNLDLLGLPLPGRTFHLALEAWL